MPEGIKFVDKFSRLILTALFEVAGINQSFFINWKFLSISLGSDLFEGKSCDFLDNTSGKVACLPARNLNSKLYSDKS